MNLIQIENEIINAEHIVDVSYAPERYVSEEDSDDGRAYTIKSKLVITTTALDVEEVQQPYTGNTLAAASASYRHLYQGKKADRIWLTLKALCAYRLEVTG